MKKVLSILVLGLGVIMLSGCSIGNSEANCDNAFDCVKIEDNSYRCSYCKDGTKTCSNPKGVTCSSSK